MEIIPVLTRGRWPIAERLSETIEYIVGLRNACETEGKPKQFPGGHKPVVSVLWKIPSWVAAGVTQSKAATSSRTEFSPCSPTLRAEGVKLKERFIGVTFLQRRKKRSLSVNGMYALSKTLLP